MSNLKIALKELGVKDSDIDNLLSETPPEGFDPKDLAVKTKEHLIEVHEAANPRTKPEDIEARGISVEKVLKVRFAKVLGIDKPRADIEKMTLDELDAVVKATKDSLSSKSDEKLKAENIEYQNKYLNTLDELDKLKETKDSEIEKANKEAALKIKSYETETILDRSYSKLPWGVKEDIKKDAIFVAKLKVKEMGWEVMPDGSLLGPGGQGKAMKPDKSGFYSNIDEFNMEALDPYMQKSQGKGPDGEGGEKLIHGIDATKISATNKESLAWLEGKE